MSRASRFPVLSLLVPLMLAVALAAGPLTPVAPAAAYNPKPGVKTNDPEGNRDQRRVILAHLLRTINSTHRKSQIKIASWNIRSDAVVNALINAHKRKVGVRVILDRLNANPDNPNYGVNRLQRELKRHGNKSRKPYLRSNVKKCVSACRGPGGIAHSKFFLFTRAGRSQHIVMNSSANATDLAASNQWNDVFTVRGRKGVYDEFRTVFTQMWRDKNVKQGYRRKDFGYVRTEAYPYRGNKTGKDPVLRELDRIRCKGAKNRSNGRTKIRIAMTSWHGKRGKKIAWRVRNLQNNGCNIRIVYAVAGNEVLRILRQEGNRPVPLRQIVKDPNNDGIYDWYLHMKVLTVKGVYRGNKKAFKTFNGSENWSPAALASDEVRLRLNNPGTLQRYNGWIDHLFFDPPPNYRATSGRTADGRTVSGRTSAGEWGTDPAMVGPPLGVLVDGKDPYALIPQG